MDALTSRLSDAEAQIERLERTVFLLVTMLRVQISEHHSLDHQDKLILAEFHDLMRGRGW